jgi:cobalt-zinc-cadmium efflux system membrane fusion protein
MHERKRVAIVFMLATSLACAGCDRVEQASARSDDEPGEKERQDGDVGTAKQPDDKPSGGRLASVQLSSEANKRADIRVDTVETGRLEASVEAPARVNYDVDRIAHVSPLVEGQVTEVNVSVGDRVEADQVVAEMRSVALGDARAAVRETKASLEVARRHFERQKTLRDKGISSEKALIEARGRLEEDRARHEAARARLESYGVSGGSGPSYPLRSGIAGTVVKQEAARGETKGPDDRLFVVAERSPIWVVGDVYESDIHRIEEGMRAVVTLEAYPTATWNGTVDWVGENLEGESRVLPVRVVLENKKRRLRPGMFGQLRLMPESVDDPVPLVPIGAVQRLDGHEAVFVPGDEEGSYHARRVQTGAESGGLVEIRDGLQLDGELVTAGAYDLKIALRAK